MIDFKSLLVSFLLLLPTVISATSYNGKYTLLEAYDKDFGEVNIPRDNISCDVSLNDNPNVDDNGKILYRFSMQVGNRLNTFVEIINDRTAFESATKMALRTTKEEEGATGGDEDIIKVGIVMSTMMMPPEAEFKLEMFLSQNLPKMEVMKLENGQLILSGAEGGKLVFKTV